MLVAGIRRTITDTERDAVLVDFAKKIATSGPFRALEFIPADPTRTPTEVLLNFGIDTAYTTRLFILDPAQFSLRNGAEAATVDALSAASGLAQGAGQQPVQWASSAVFSVINTRRRAQARNLASEYLARSRALAAPEVQADEELKEIGTRELADARDQLQKALRRAYQHVVFVAQPDPDGERYLDQTTFDDDTLTSLNGTSVWKALADKDKAFDAGQFDAQALLHNLREQDYGKTLSDLRAAFYSALRLPLLYAGDTDLQHAIFDAVNTGELRIIDAAGTEVAATAPGQVNLSSTGLRIARPAPATCPTCAQPAHPGACTSPTAGTGSQGQDSTPAGAAPAASGGSRAGGAAAGGAAAPAEKSLAFSFTTNLLAGPDAADGFAAVFRALYIALDERQLSYLQGTLNLVADAATAEELGPLLAELGLTVAIKDL